MQVHRVTMRYVGVTPTANTEGCSTVSCLVELVQGTLRIHKTFTHYYVEVWHIFSVGAILITLCFYELARFMQLAVSDYDDVMLAGC